MHSGSGVHVCKLDSPDHHKLKPLSKHSGNVDTRAVHWESGSGEQRGFELQDAQACVKYVVALCDGGGITPGRA